VLEFDLLLQPGEGVLLDIHLWVDPQDSLLVDILVLRSLDMVLRDNQADLLDIDPGVVLHTHYFHRSYSADSVYRWPVLGSVLAFSLCPCPWAAHWDSR